MKTYAFFNGLLWHVEDRILDGADILQIMIQNKICKGAEDFKFEAQEQFDLFVDEIKGYNLLFSNEINQEKWVDNKANQLFEEDLERNNFECLFSDELSKEQIESIYKSNPVIIENDPILFDQIKGEL